MRMLPAMIVAASLTFGAPLAFADIVIAPEIGIRFHDDVKVKKYKSRKWDGDELKVGVVVRDVDYYDVPEEVIVATPTLKGHRYVYLNDHIYLVDGDSRIVAIVD